MEVKEGVNQEAEVGIELLNADTLQLRRVGDNSMKKTKKYAKSIIGGTIGMAAGSLALGAVGGTSAGYGQAALANVSAFAPAAGTVIGATLPLRMINKSFGKVKIRKKR